MAEAGLRNNVAALLAATRRLQLRVRKLVAAVKVGMHASPRAGLGREFTQFRAYQPGDEPRQIDWKLYARSDRFFIREGDVERLLPVRIVIDASGSMAQEGRDGRQKFTAAQELAGALGALAEEQGDIVSIVAVENGGVRLMPPNTRRSLLRSLHFLAQLAPAGHWPQNAALVGAAFRKTANAQLGPRAVAELTVVITDAHEHAGEIRAAILPLLARRNEILWLHLQTRDEIEFPYRGLVRFQEWETGRFIEMDASAARPQFLAAQKAELEMWRKKWESPRFEYFPVVSDEPLQPALRAFLRRRSAR